MSAACPAPHRRPVHESQHVRICRLPACPQGSSGRLALQVYHVDEGGLACVFPKPVPPACLGESLPLGLHESLQYRHNLLVCASCLLFSTVSVACPAPQQSLAVQQKGVFFFFFFWADKGLGCQAVPACLLNARPVIPSCLMRFAMLPDALPRPPGGRGSDFSILGGSGLSV